MGFNIKLLKKEDYKTSSWSGGTTTEFLIFPPEATYRARDFKYRLSSAIVKDYESTFTNLPGISRIIMILEGELLLKHEGHHQRALKAFEQDSFSGEWITKSYGKAIDFNLMMSEGSTGKLDLISIKPSENIELNINNDKFYKDYNYFAEVFYCVNGEAEVLIKENERIYIKQGNLVYVNGDINEEEVILRFSNKCEKTTRLIRSSIYLNIGEI